MTSINAIKYVPNRISLTFNIPFLSFGTMNLKIGHSLVMPDRLFYHAKSNLCICLVFRCKGNSFSLVKQFLLCT